MNWLRMIWGAVKGAVSSTNVGDIFDSVTDLYMQRAEAKSSEELARIDAQIEVLRLQARQTGNLQGYWLTAWIRPAFAIVVLFYVGKSMVWDAALHLGTTDRIEGVVEWAAVGVVSFFFLMRPLEKRL